jgi:CelD/BcsL family acetyltransferase involved in cellulose biosynthesis
MQFEILRPEALSPQDAETWRAFARLHPDTRSAYLGPDYARICAMAGPDARRGRVLVIREGGEAAGFLSYREGRFGACAIGAPFTDYQALVARPGLALDRRALLRGMGVGRLDFAGVPDSQSLFAPYFRETDISLTVTLADGYAAYEKERRAAGTEVLQDCARKRRKMEREIGEVVFDAQPRNLAALDLLLDWKSRQFRASGQPDVLAPVWPRALLGRLVESENPNCRAEIFTLSVGGRIISIHLALRGEIGLHAWIIAYDEAFHRYSPGAVLIHEILKWLPQAGLTELDFGPNTYPFKHRMANGRRGVGIGYLGRPSLSAGLVESAWRLRTAAEKAPLGPVSHWPAKAMRRIERYAALHAS